MEITVATWNVLADCYVRGQTKNSVPADEGSANAAVDSIAESVPNHLRWPFRSTLIERCFKECSADVFLLQEVDHFIDFYEPRLAGLGYTSCYLQRPGRNDGCLIAFKSDRFAVVDESQVSLDESIDADSLYEQQKYQKQNVGLLLKLLDTASQKMVIVATCHVHWNPNLPEVKTSQVLYMLRRLQQFRANDTTTPVILTGDFNTLPQDQIYPCINHPDNITLLADMVASHRFDGALYGPKTRFLCDASLSKLCKWMRVLGVNVALDSWDNGVPASSNKHKNASKWQWTCAHNARIKSDKKNAKDNKDASSDAVSHGGEGVDGLAAVNAAATPDGEPVAGDGAAAPPKAPAGAATKDTSSPIDITYAARVASINAFFARADREKRVILTTSKTLRERSTCPRSFYVNPQDIEAGLIEICAQFALGLSKERFLTVCGKCGDEVEEVSLQDPRLVDKYLPTDRTVFACVNCAQPYWWNEKAGSLPALAMEKAEQLYEIVQTGISKRQQVKSTPSTASIDTTSTTAAAAAAVSPIDRHQDAVETVKPRVKAGTCILKDFGRTAKNPSLRNLGVSSAYSDSKSAELELEQQRALQAAQQQELASAESITPEAESSAEQGCDDSSPVLTTSDGCEECAAELDAYASTGALATAPDEGEASTETQCTPPLSLTAPSAAKVIASTSSTAAAATVAKVGGRPNTPQMSMETLTALFANRERSLIESTSRTASACVSPGVHKEGVVLLDTADLQASFAAQNNKCDAQLPGLALRSVFQVTALQAGSSGDNVDAEAEPALTNWNGEFKGTLDYIFVSEQWSVRQPTRVFPTLPANYSNTNKPADGSADSILRQEVNAAQPSLVWPSDHFIVYATLEI